MKKAELVRKIQEIGDFKSEKSAGHAYDSVVEAIKQCVLAGEEVTLLGLGKFVAVDVASRTARNPKTGEEVIVPEKKAVKFRASTVFKQELNA